MTELLACIINTHCSTVSTLVRGASFALESLSNILLIGLILWNVEAWERHPLASIWLEIGRLAIIGDYIERIKREKEVNWYLFY